MPLFRRLRNVGRRISTAIRERFRRRRNRNRSERSSSPSPRRDPPLSSASASPTPLPRRELPPNPNLALYNHYISLPHPRSGAVLESQIVHNRVLAIFKQVEPGKNDTVLHAERFKEAVKDATTDRRIRDLHQALEVASRNVGEDGATQYTLAGVIRGVLRGVCVGESRLVVIRNGAVHFESPRSVRGFKKPMTNRDVADGKCIPAAFRFQLAEGDVIVFGCDGLWDNVEMDRITELVERAVRGVATFGEVSGGERDNTSVFGMVFRRIEGTLESLIRTGMRDRRWFSPYAEDGRANGTNVSGGRPDSCSVFLSIVVDGRTREIPADWSLSTLSV